VGLSLLATVGTFAYQVLLYLKQGYWTAYTAIGFCATQLKLEWCAAPNDWVGLHKMLELFSPGGAMFVLSLGLMYLCIAIAESGSKSTP
jgi:hypothetical protein